MKGNGYTNHCPQCLWGKHVDVNPGDRLAECGGMMEPCGLETKNSEHIILYRCVACGFERKNKTSPADNFDAVLKITRRM